MSIRVISGVLPQQWYGRLPSLYPGPVPTWYRAEVDGRRVPPQAGGHLHEFELVSMELTAVAVAAAHRHVPV